LTAQHNILSRLFGDALTSSRIHLGNPSKVLDCGYGGGDWCVQFAEEFEDCEVRMLLMHTALVLDEVNF
jgi:ubiquinone/menaquinone biosynthesis C-methylase UbiE